MTLERQRGILVFTCDECGVDADVKLHDFKQAFAEIKSEGWVARMNKGTGQWEHFCEVCKNDYGKS